MVVVQILINKFHQIYFIIIINDHFHFHKFIVNLQHHHHQNLNLIIRHYIKKISQIVNVLDVIIKNHFAKIVKQNEKKFQILNNILLNLVLI